MSLAHSHGSCPGSGHCTDRRRFLQGCGAAAVTAAGSLLPGSHAAAGKKADAKVRVATVFLASMNTREIWPYPGFDTERRQREILSALGTGCPETEFVPVTVQAQGDLRKAVALKDEVDGYLVYAMTLVWNQRGMIVEMARLGKPTLVADEFLGGSGVFLTGVSALATSGTPVAAVSSTRLDDLVAVAREFAGVREPGATPASFARRCEHVYRKTFPATGRMTCTDDPVPLNDVNECVKRFRESRFLIVGRGHGGQERDFLGATGRYVDFGELSALYEQVDPAKAAKWAERWTGEAEALPPGDYVEPSRPSAEAVRKAGRMYLATLKLCETYGTDSVTINCLGGFSAGKLASYPCLGFMQIQNDGGQGVCEAMPDDTLSMLMVRILTGRPGFVSDPALDTSRNRIVYAHCVGTTRVFGPKGDANAFRIRTLHNRDPRGACAESMMPAGYMTTSCRTNAGRKELIIHQAKALGPLETEKGCRTKLVGEVRGDIGKMFDQWDRFGWHRVTVYGDVKEPLAEFAKALGLKVIEEA